MYKAKEVQAHGWGQSTDHHPGEDETVLIGLVVWRQVVEVQETDLEDRGIRAVEHVGDYYC